MTKKKRQRKEARLHEVAGARKQLPPDVDDDAIDDDYPDTPYDPRADERLIARLNRMANAQGTGTAELIQSIIDEQRFVDEDLLKRAPPPTTPLEKAQEVMYDAFATDDPHRRVRLARKALSISPDCADAYVVLAEEVTDAAEARAHYQHGVEAGERALGSAFFSEHAGDSWLHLEARPYMRALYGLGLTSWALQMPEEAFAHYREALRLDKDDYQGVRYSLAACLQARGRDDELGELLQRFDDEESAYWLFTRALWRYRDEGSSGRATRELKDAVKVHPHVPLYLLGRKHFMVGGLPGMSNSEEEGEAAAYFIGGIHHWLKTPGAVEWMRENVDERRLSQLERESEAWSLPEAAALTAAGAS